MISKPSDDNNLRAMRSHAAARLAPYCNPIPPAIKRGLALEDAIAAVQRALCAATDASLDEPDKHRVAALREIYIDLRFALTDLRKLSE